MAKQDKPQKFANWFMAILVYGNRLEVRQGWWPTQRRKIIPYQNIAAIGIGQFTRRLEITTNDGKTVKYGFPNAGKTRRCHDAIIARM